MEDDYWELVDEWRAKADRLVKARAAITTSWLDRFKKMPPGANQLAPSSDFLSAIPELWGENGKIEYDS